MNQYKIHLNINKKFMKTSITIIILFLSSSIYAQFPAGSLLIKGATSYSNSNSNTDFTNSTTSTSNSNTFRVSPSIKYFNKTNFAITGGVNYNSTVSKSKSGNTSSESTSKSIGAFGGFQKFDFLSDKFGISYGMTLGFTIPMGLKEFETKYVNIGIDVANIGVIYNINNKLALEGNGNLASLTFNTTKRETTSSTSKSNSINFGFGLPTFGIGFLYKLK